MKRKMFSFNPNTPMLLNSYTPALEPGTSFDIVYTNMPILHNTREFIKNECSENIRC